MEQRGNISGWRAALTGRSQNPREQLVRRSGGVEAQHRDREARKPAFVPGPAAPGLGSLLILRRPLHELAMGLIHRSVRQQGVAESALLALAQPFHPDFGGGLQED